MRGRSNKMNLDLSVLTVVLVVVVLVLTIVLVYKQSEGFGSGVPEPGQEPPQAPQGPPEVAPEQLLNGGVALPASQGGQGSSVSGTCEMNIIQTISKPDYKFKHLKAHLNSCNTFEPYPAQAQSTGGQGAGGGAQQGGAQQGGAQQGGAQQGGTV